MSRTLLLVAVTALCCTNDEIVAEPAWIQTSSNVQWTVLEAVEMQPGTLNVDSNELRFSYVTTLAESTFFAALGAAAAQGGWVPLEEGSGRASFKRRSAMNDEYDVVTTVEVKFDGASQRVSVERQVGPPIPR
jgi:hypothetical protein